MPSNRRSRSTSSRLMDALKIKKAIDRRLRLGRADGRHRRCALAGALQGARLRERISDHQPRGRTSSRCRRRPSWGGGTSTTSPRNAARSATTKYRHDFNKLIWKIASPKWNFDDATFDRTAASFDNPDHVGIVIHNYRWRLSLAKGEPQVRRAGKEARRAPVITVPDHHHRERFRRCGRRRTSLCQQILGQVFAPDPRGHRPQRAAGSSAGLCQGGRRRRQVRHMSLLAALLTAMAPLPVEGELPSLGGATGWLNSPPLTPAGLRGKVVLDRRSGPTPASTGCAHFPMSARGPRNTRTRDWW